MSRLALGVLGCITLALSAGCSGDAKDGDKGTDNSGTGSAFGDGGSGPGNSNAGSGGSSASAGGGGSAGSAATGPTYTAARACQLFARASCDKGVQCGLVLGQVGTDLICVQCNAFALGVIEQSCVQDSPGEKDAAAVDRCVANISAQPCAQACVEPDVSGCEAFGDLPAGTQGLVCDVRCVG